MVPARAHVAFITGGAGGIGIQIARSLGRDGMRVVVADVRHDDAISAAATLSSEGIDAAAVALDVTSRDSVDSVVNGVLTSHGSLDVMVNGAGFPIDLPLVDMTDDAWRTVLDVCLYGTFACCRAVAPAMIDQGYGRIVNISSRAYLGNPGQANYSAAKAGIVGLTKSLAKELGRHAITVNAVAPGMIDTAMVRRHSRSEAIIARASAENSIKRIGRPEEVADAVSFLASRAAGFITGDVLHVSGGRFG